MSNSFSQSWFPNRLGNAERHDMEDVSAHSGPAFWRHTATSDCE